MNSPSVETTATERYCENCDYRHMDTRDKQTYHWRCVLVPYVQRGGCSKEAWHADPPYMKCEDVNRFKNCGWHKEARNAE